MSDHKQPFDPTLHLTSVGGNPYLEVKFRLAWFRDVYPEGQIITELVRLENKETVDRNGQIFRTALAVFRAHVSTGNGGVATGYGSETEADFRDHIEKAESKALGRALAALGFGTQFTGYEFAGEAAADRPVDSPVPMYGQQPQQPVAPSYPPRAQQGGAQQGAQQQGGQQQSFKGVQNPTADATQGQKDYIADLLRGIRQDPDHFDFSGLKRGEASQWIESLKNGVLPDFAHPNS